MLTAKQLRLKHGGRQSFMVCTLAISESTTAFETVILSCLEHDPRILRQRSSDKKVYGKQPKNKGLWAPSSRPKQENSIVDFVL